MSTIWKNGKYQPLVKYVTLKDLKKLSTAIDIINGDSDTKGSIKKAIKDLVGEAPEAYDTLKEIADKLKSDDDLHKALNDAIILKASSDALNTEINRATSAETILTTNLNNEITRASSEEQKLKKLISDLDTTKAQEILKKAETATTSAEKVNATITEENVFEVTDRTGTKKSLDMSGLVSAQDTIKKLQDSKIDKTSILQESGDAEDKVMSQKAVSDELRDLASRMTETLDASFTPDLSIGDGNVQFRDGHIKTKNFDSSQTSKPLKDKTFSILGDSISTYQGYLVSNESGYDGSSYAYYYPRYGVDNVNKTWWKKLEELSGMKILHNCSWSGSQVAGDSTSSAQVGCSNRRIADLGRNNTKPDIILILIGVNDLRNNDSHALGEWTANDELPTEGSVDTFSAAYALMVSKVLTAYPTSEVYCCTILDTGNTGWDTHDATKYPCMNSRNNTTYQWNQKIKEVAKGLGANILDMHECGINYFNLSTFTGDRLHPNADGTTLMAKKAYSELLNKSKLVY